MIIVLITFLGVLITVFYFMPRKGFINCSLNDVPSFSVYGSEFSIPETDLYAEFNIYPENTTYLNCYGEIDIGDQRFCGDEIQTGAQIKVAKETVCEVIGRMSMDGTSDNGHLNVFYGGGAWALLPPPEESPLGALNVDTSFIGASSDSILFIRFSNACEIEYRDGSSIDVPTNTYVLVRDMPNINSTGTEQIRAAIVPLGSYPYFVEQLQEYHWQFNDAPWTLDVQIKNCVSGSMSGNGDLNFYREADLKTIHLLGNEFSFQSPDSSYVNTDINIRVDANQEEPTGYSTAVSMQMSGNVNDASISIQNLFPNFRDWLYDNFAALCVSLTVAIIGIIFTGRLPEEKPKLTVHRICPHKGRRAILMPTLSMFLGILIKMNWKDIGQHKKPHFLAYYGEYEAVFGLDGEIIAGNFPSKQSAFVKAWALLHEEELAADWKLAETGEETFRIDPLK